MLASIMDGPLLNEGIAWNDSDNKAIKKPNRTTHGYI